MYAWQFAKALFTADQHGWTRFVSMQDHYNLLYREEEREMYGLCADQGIGVIPYSPLARGLLTRDWGSRSTRTESDRLIAASYPPDDRTMVEAVARIADQRGVSRAQLTMAWVLRNPAAGQVLVRVLASSVNSLDGGIAAGMFEQFGMPHQYPLTLGRDAAGTVEAVGDGVTSVPVGDRVPGVR